MVAALTTSDMKKLISEHFFLNLKYCAHFRQQQKSKIPADFSARKNANNLYQGRRKLTKSGRASSTMGRGHNLSPLFDIWVTDTLKTRWATAHPAHPSPTPLWLCIALLPMYTVHTYIVSRYVDYWKRQMKNFPGTHPPYLLLSLFCFVFLSKGKIGPYHVQF